MKKVLLSIICAVLLLPLFVKADSKLVKVYIFEAGGCPYCEAEIDYLKGLESYGKKFEIVRKELYVDHVDWANGKDYDLGVKVAKAFKEAGFSEASYQATPFVVISDVYAAASYNTDLEDYINTAYEKGDKDVVQCISDGKENCIKKESATSVSGSGLLYGMMLLCTGAIIAVYIIKSTKDKNDILDAIK